jgi:ankyrin repeat protein
MISGGASTQCGVRFPQLKGVNNNNTIGVSSSALSKATKSDYLKATNAADGAHPAPADAKSDRYQPLAPEEVPLPLHAATIKGDLAEVQKLLDSGAKADSKCAQFSIVYGRASVLKLLIEWGVDVVKEVGLVQFFYHEKHASEKQHAEVCKVLLDANADVNGRCKTHHRTPLMYACHCGAGIVCEVLLTAKADVELSDKEDGTGLVIASKTGHIRICKMLLCASATVNTVDNADSRYTALHWAAQQGYPKVCSLLIQAHADTELKNHEEATALFKGALTGHVDVCDILIAAGTNVNSQGTQGWTPLLVAAFHQQDDACQTLLVAKANPGSRLEYGKLH